MRTIPLTQGREAIVSDLDYAYLNQWNWYFERHHSGRGGYARRQSARPRQRGIYLHNVVAARMGLTGTIDHRDRDKLNNRRSNLRPATKCQNAANRGLYQNNTSRFRGVTWHSRDKKYVAGIRVNKRRKHLGYFDNPVEAARAYNKAAKAYFGKFAVLNTFARSK